MNTISKNKFLTAVVILLLLANIVSIVTFWWTRENAAPPPPGSGGSSAANFLVHELSFDAKQQELYKLLREEHQQQTKLAREKVRESRKIFFDLLDKDSVNAFLLKNLSEEIGKNEGQLQLFTFEHFRKVRALCNELQKKKFDSIIQEVLRMMGGQQASPPPPKRMDGGNPPPPDQMQDGPPPPLHDNHPAKEPQ